jgi:hypothetical protein
MKLIDVLLENVDLSSAVPEDTSYRDFAKAVAKMLREDYGEHNFGPFMEVLHAELGMNEAVNEEVGELESIKARLEADPENKYLTFIIDRDKDEIRVGGRESEKFYFAQRNEEEDFGNYRIFDVDDDDRGTLVYITRKK